MQRGRWLTILDNVNVTVKDREFLSVVGPSGCGKTTLLHMIAGLPPHFPPKTGSIEVGSKIVRGPGRDRVMVFQDHAVYPWLTVEDNIRFGLREKTSREGDEIVDRYLGLMKLDQFRKAHPFQLSIGMRQRVGLARALAMQPKVLLMDEPFASVDALTRLELQRELLQIWELEQMTVVFVTHSIDEAIALASRVLVLSPPPTGLVGDLPVDLPHPRSHEELRSNATYLALHRHISELLGVAG